MRVRPYRIKSTTCQPVPQKEKKTKKKKREKKKKGKGEGLTFLGRCRVKHLVNFRRSAAFWSHEEVAMKMCLVSRLPEDDWPLRT